MAAKKPPEADLVRFEGMDDPRLSGMSMHVRTQLAACETADEAEAIRAKAEGMRAFLRLQDPALVRGLLIEAAEISMRAMRRIGELLPQAAPGTRTNKAKTRSANEGDTPLPPAEEVSAAATSRYRALAAIDLDVFEGALGEARAARREVTQTALLRLAPAREQRGPRKPPPTVVAAFVQRAGVLADDPARAFFTVVIENLLALVAGPLDNPTRVEALLTAVAHVLEQDQLPRLNPDVRREDWAPHRAVTSAIATLPELGADIARALRGEGPRDAADTRYARPHRQPLPREDRR